jgi:hypothetical protein
MTRLWIRPRDYPRWCLLRGVGALSMMTACHAPMAAREHVQIDHAPPDCDRCTACVRELAARPGVAVEFDVENLDDDYEELAIKRETGEERR